MQLENHTTAMSEAVTHQTDQIPIIYHLLVCDLCLFERADLWSMLYPHGLDRVADNLRDLAHVSLRWTKAR